MSTNMSGPQVPPAGRNGDTEVPIRVYGCSRLGLQANPPTVRGPLSGWLRRR